MKKYLDYNELSAITNEETAKWFSESDEGIYETENGYSCYIRGKEYVCSFKNADEIIEYVQEEKQWI